MDNSEPKKSPESFQNNKDAPEIDEDAKRPHIWEPFYLIVGITGLSFSIFSGFRDFSSIVPLYGTIVAAVLVAALSILLIVYGFRILRRDI